MQLTIDEAYLPARLTSGPMSDEEFIEFCADYPDHLIELTAEGEIVIMPPNVSFTASQSGEIFGQLRNWAVLDRRGIATDSSGGFRLPDHALLAPDAAWTLKSVVRDMSRRRFWSVCPEFVIELRSPSDRLRTLRAKMQEWIENGSQLGWLIDPDREAVEIYRPNQPPEIREHIDCLTGEGPAEGFVLDLKRVWNPLEI